MAEVTERVFGARRWLIASGVAALLGWAISFVGVVLDPARALHAWLAALVFCTTIAVGALIFLLIGYAVNGTWMAALRRINEAVVGSLPALGIMFIPIIVGADHLYVWTDPGQIADEHVREIIHHKEPWLNLPAFTVRTGVYFAVLIVIAELFRTWSMARARDPEARTTLTRERVVASATLPAVGLALTFASFDWTMSLEPAWYSTAYGVYYFAGGFLGALALLTVLAWVVASRLEREGEVPVITPYHFHALGRLMFTFVVFWAYIAFFQVMLIKIANKPEEVTFFVARSAGSWRWVSWSLILGHFLLPFLYLLPRSPKFRGGAMALVAGWILVMHSIDAIWLVLPVHLRAGMELHWVDPGAFLAVVGTAVFVAAVRQRGRHLFAIGDPRLAASIEYRSL